MIVQLVVHNNIPDDWVTVSEGISIHFHGFSLRDDPNGAWYDGVSYLTQCPILNGQSFTYRFLVSLTCALPPSLLPPFSPLLFSPPLFSPLCLTPFV